MKASMERIRKLVLHPLFQEQAAFLKDAEKDRIFCRHSIEHLLDVARIMYIYNLEDGCGLNRELIYAAALLHDIGRPDQMRYQTPHPAAGARIAGIILPECGFSPEDTRRIQHAISGHRSLQQTGDPLSEYLCRADKQSRCCFCCPAFESCNWPEEKKNKQIEY